jgi:hypothetical protein
LKKNVSESVLYDSEYLSLDSEQPVNGWRTGMRGLLLPFGLLELGLCLVITTEEPSTYTTLIYDTSSTPGAVITTVALTTETIDKWSTSYDVETTSTYCKLLILAFTQSHAEDRRLGVSFS